MRERPKISMQASFDSRPAGSDGRGLPESVDSAEDELIVLTFLVSGQANLFADLVSALIQSALPEATVTLDSSVQADTGGVRVSLESTDRWLFVRILAGFATLIAAATLFENLSGVDLGIDMLFVTEAPGALAPGAPGRMGVPASTTLTLLGTAFFLSSFVKYRRAANVLGIAALCIPLLSCFGYAFGSSMLYSIPKITGIAVQTAIMLVVLALGFIAALPDVGIGAATWRNDAGGVVLRQLLLAAAAFPILLGLFVSLAVRSELFDLEFGIAVRTLVEIILFTGLIWWTARKANLAETQHIAEAKARADARTARLLIEAQDGERDRLARDLHDSIGAAVTGIRLALTSFSLTHPGKDVVQKDLDSIARQLEDLDDEVSLLAWQIKPAPLENLGLGATEFHLIRHRTPDA